MLAVINEEKVDSMLDRIEHMVLNREENLKSIQHLVEKTEEYCETLNYEKGISRLEMIRVHEFYYTSQYDSAQYFLEKIRSKINFEQEPELYLQSSIRLGVLNKNQGNYEGAMRYYVEVIRLSRQISKPYFENMAIQNVGVLYGLLGMYHKSILNFKNAVQFIKNISDAEMSGQKTRNLMHCYHNIAQSYLNLSLVDSALTYEDSVLLLVPKLDEKFTEIGSVYTVKSRAYLLLGNLDSSNYYLEKSIYEKKSINDLKKLTSSFRLKSEILMAEKSLDRAEVYLDSALYYMHSSDNAEDKLYLYQLASKIYSIKGNYRDAYKYLYSSNQINDSLLLLKKQMSMSSLEIDLQDALQSAEQKVIEISDDLAIKQKQSKNLLMLLISLVATILFLFLLVVIRQKKAIENLNNTLESKVKDRTEKLENTNNLLEINIKKLEKTNKELDKFIYSASHDIRSPLASISGLISLCNSEKDEKELKKYYQMMQDTLAKLEDFIGDLVDYSRNERTEIQYTKTDIKELVNDIISQQKHSSKINIKTKIDIDVPVMVDKLRLEVILTNLISNGIKYSDDLKEENLLLIHVYHRNGKMIIQIKDNGIGIPEHLLKRVTELFFRAHSEKSKGSGIGLYLVNETIEKLKGTFHIDSQEGIGTRIKIEIPAELTAN